MKNKILLIFMVGIFICPSFEVLASNDNNFYSFQTINENISVSKPFFDTNGDFVILYLEEVESNLMINGKPILPVISKSFTFPLGTEILDISILYDVEPYNVPGIIRPCTQQLSNDQQIRKFNTDLFILEDSIYKSNQFYPKQPFYIKESAGLINNEHMLFYSVHVVPQYCPLENIIKIPKSIDISIDYKVPEEPFLSSNNIFDMVVITPEEFNEDLQLLIDHKNTIGINTFLKTTQEIYSEYSGKDQAEKIKWFIKDAIEQYGIRYVFLIGDIHKIPMRKTDLTWDYFGDLVVPDVITDLYYSDIYDANGSFSEWDSNQDGIFSEIHMIMDFRPYDETLEIIDTVDLNPDVIIGRLPCSSRNDVKNIVNKIMYYEQETKNTNWFKRLILMGGDTFPSTGGINEGEFVTDYIASIMSDFQPIRLWTSLNKFKPLKINLEISKGAGFVSYSGHGFEYGFATSEPDNPSAIFYYLPYVLGIHNRQKYPIMYFDACLTASLDYAYSNMNIPCLAWAMIKKQNSGAVACIGSTRVGFGGFAGNPFQAGTSCLHRYFYESYEESIYLGDMFISAQQQFIEEIINNVIYDPLTVQEFTLLGDPSLKIGGYI